MAAKRKSESGDPPSEESDLLTIRPLWVIYLGNKVHWTDLHLVHTPWQRGWSGSRQVLYHAWVQEQKDNGMYTYHRQWLERVNLLNSWCKGLSVLSLQWRSSLFLNLFLRPPIIALAPMHCLSYLLYVLFQLDCGIHPGLSGMDSLPYTDMIEADEIDLLLITQCVWHHRYSTVLWFGASFRI